MNTMDDEQIEYLEEPEASDGRSRCVGGKIGHGENYYTEEHGGVQYNVCEDCGRAFIVAPWRPGMEML